MVFTKAETVNQLGSEVKKDEKIKQLETELSDLKFKLNEMAVEFVKEAEKMMSNSEKQKVLEEKVQQYERKLVEVEEKSAKLTQENVKLRNFLDNVVGIIETKTGQLIASEEKVKKQDAEIRSLSLKLSSTSALSQSCTVGPSSGSGLSSKSSAATFLNNPTTLKPQLQRNQVIISLEKFQVNDNVLFVKDSHGNWEIFHRNQPGYFLSHETCLELMKRSNYGQILCVQAQLLFIEEVVASKGNPYDFIEGARFHQCYIYPLEG